MSAIDQGDVPHRLIAEFQKLATADGGVDRLRSLVLSLAVRGLLVQQDSRDEPATTLVQASRHAIAALSAIGAGRRERAADPIAESEIPYELPSAWAWVRLGTLLTKIGAGSTPLGGREVYTASGVKFLRSQNVWNRGLDLSQVAYIPAAVHAKMNGTKVVAGDLLFNITGASIGRCALVPEDFDEGNVSQHVTILRTALPAIRDFLHLVLISDSVQQTVRDVQVGVSREGLSIAKLGRFVVPIPPLAEQHRIVARVDELMALCDALELNGRLADQQHERLTSALFDALAASASAHELAENWKRVEEHFDVLLDRPEAVDSLEQVVIQLAVKGLLTSSLDGDEPAEILLGRIRDERRSLGGHAMVDKGEMRLVDQDDQSFELPTNWMWVRFNDLVRADKPIAYGVLVPGPDTPDGVPFVRLADLAIEGAPTLPAKTIARSVDSQFLRTRLEGGEILLGVVGSIGKLGVAPDSWRGANIARAVCRIVPSKWVDKGYLLCLLQSEFMRSRFVGDTRTLAQPTLNIGLIRDCPAPLPPLAEQRRIVARVDELRALCAQLRERLTSARRAQSALADALVADII